MSREIFALHGIISAIGLENVVTGLKALEGNYIKAEKALTQFGRQSAKIGSILTKNITAPFAALGAAAAAATIKTVDYAEKMVKLEGVTGLTTDTLQELQHVSKMMNVDFEGLTGTVGIFARQLPAIAKEGGPAFNTLRKLGVNIHDSSGHIRNINELFPELIKKLQLIENPLERVSAAQQIFGRGAAELGPILGMTGAQFEAMRKEAHDLGIVIDKETLKSAEAFGDEIGKLKRQAGAMVMKLASDFLPILRDDILPLIKTKIIPAIQGFADKIRALIVWFRDLDGSTKILIGAIIGITAAAGPFLLILGKSVLAVKELTVAAKLLNKVFLTNPFGIALTGATALVAALLALKSAHDKVKESIENDAKATGMSIEATTQYYKDKARIAKINASFVMIAERDEILLLNKRIKAYEDAVAAAKKLNELKKLELFKGETAAPGLKWSPGDPDAAKKEAEENAKLALSIDEKLTREMEAEQSRRRDNQLKAEKDHRDDMVFLKEEEARFFEETAKETADAQIKINDRIRGENESLVTSYMQFGVDIGSAIIGGIQKGGEGFKGALKGILNSFLSFLEKLVLEAIFASSLKNFITLGFFGFIKAASEAAFIIAGFEAVKAGVSSFGEGALVLPRPGGVHAILAEKGEPELVLPMRTGVRELSREISNSMITNNNQRGEYHLHVGTLIADDRGLKQLERQLFGFRIQESQRKGAD